MKGKGFENKFFILGLVFCLMILMSAMPISIFASANSNITSDGLNITSQINAKSLKEGIHVLSSDLVNLSRYNVSIAVKNAIRVGRYTEATAEGKRLLFGYPDLCTSHTTIRIDGNDYCPDVTMDSYVTQMPTILGDSIVTKWTLPQNVNISQDLTLMPDTTKYRLAVTNNDHASHNIKIRYMFDTMLADNDGAPFRVPGVGDITTEQEFINPVFDYWQAMDRLANPTLTSNCIFVPGKKPYKVQFAKWRGIMEVPFDYTISEGRDITSDTAVGMYWDLGTLVPGETKDVVVYYGTLNIIKIKLVDAKTMEEVESAFSTRSKPSIVLDPISISDISFTSEGLAQVSISGNVYDQIADIVPNNAADITTISIEGQELAVTRDPSEPTSKARPYAFKGRFSGTIMTPLADGEKIIVVETGENALGLKGEATFSINACLTERMASDGFYFLNPFRIRVEQEFDPEFADHIWMLLSSNISLVIDNVFNPLVIDQVVLKIEQDEITLSEDGLNSLNFTGSDPRYGDLQINFTSFSGLQVDTVDTARSDVAVSALWQGSLPFFFEETGEDTKNFVGNREVDLLESDNDTLIFQASTSDYGNVQVRVTSFTGVQTNEIDSLYVMVSIATLWVEDVTFTMQETDTDTKLFDVLLTGDSAEVSKVREMEVESTSLGTTTGAGIFKSYFVRMYDSSAQPKEYVTIEGIHYELETEQQGVYITKEPFIFIREAENISDDHLIINADDFIEGEYNPTEKWANHVLTLDDFFAGLYYIAGSNLQFDEGTEGLIRINLGQDVDELKVEIYPKSKQNNKVYVKTFGADSPMTRRGEHRFWDGKTNMGVDADARQNVRGQESKYIDPAFGVHILKVTTKRGVNVVSTTLTFTPLCKNLFVYNGSDRVANPNRPIPTPYASGGLAYQLAGFLATNSGQVLISRFTAQADPNARTVVYDFADGVTFRDVYLRLTARGKLTTIGHGSQLAQNGILLDGANWYPGFTINNNPAAPIINGRAYPLPYLGVHGVTTNINHCFSALNVSGNPNQVRQNAMVSQFLTVLTNNKRGVGGGTVYGYSTFFEITYSACWINRAAVLRNQQYFNRWDTVYTRVDTAASGPGPGAIGRPIHEDINDNWQIDPGEDLNNNGVLETEGLCGKTRRGAIVQNQNTLNMAVAKGFRTARGPQPHNVILFNRRGQPAVNDPFTYTALNGAGRRDRLTGVVGLLAHPNNQYVVRFPGRGNVLYHARYVINRYPIERRQQQQPSGRIARFRADVLTTINLGGRVNADQWAQFILDYRGISSSTGRKLSVP